MPTVIVPAHNEEKNILKCLRSIESQIEHSKIIVACNGCTDNTVSLVQQSFPNIVCLDIPKPSKVNALNEAEKHVVDWPVFYIDADVELSINAIQKVTDFLRNSSVLLAAPEPKIDLSKSPFLVKKFYQVWLDLPYIREGVIATCSFVITEEGRKRFQEFPDVIADDNFVRSHFYENEISNVPGCNVFVSAPKTLWSLIKIKSRSRLGTMEIEHKKIGISDKNVNYGSILIPKIFSRHFFRTFIYISLVSIFRLRARRQFRNLSSYQWEKDDTTRS